MTYAPVEDPPPYSNISDAALRLVCQLKGPLSSSQLHHPTVVGEWSVAQTPSKQSVSQDTVEGGPALAQGRRAEADQSPASSLVQEYGPPGRRRRAAGASRAAPSPEPPRGAEPRSRDASADLAAYRRQLFDTQSLVYERNAAGWLMFTWRTEDDTSPWSYTAGLKGGWIPGDLSSGRTHSVC